MKFRWNWSTYKMKLMLVLISTDLQKSVCYLLFVFLALQPIMVVFLQPGSKL